MKFEFATDERIIFGPGTVSEAASNALGIGKRACLVTGSSIERAGFLIEQLDEKKIKYVTFTVTGEPTTIIVRQELKPHEKLDVILL